MMDLSASIRHMEVDQPSISPKPLIHKAQPVWLQSPRVGDMERTDLTDLTFPSQELNSLPDTRNAVEVQVCGRNSAELRQLRDHHTPGESHAKDTLMALHTEHNQFRSRKEAEAMAPSAFDSPTATLPRTVGGRPDRNVEAVTRERTHELLSATAGGKDHVVDLEGSHCDLDRLVAEVAANDHGPLGAGRSTSSMLRAASAPSSHGSTAGEDRKRLAEFSPRSTSSSSNNMSEADESVHRGRGITRKALKGVKTATKVIMAPFKRQPNVVWANDGFTEHNTELYQKQKGMHDWLDQSVHGSPDLGRLNTA